MNSRVIWIHWEPLSSFVTEEGAVAGLEAMEQDLEEEFRLDLNPMAIVRLNLSALEDLAAETPLFLDPGAFAEFCADRELIGDREISIWTPDSQLHNYTAAAAMRDFRAVCRTRTETWDPQQDPENEDVFDWLRRGRPVHRAH
jgi:hypothetical protein